MGVEPTENLLTMQVSLHRNLTGMIRDVTFWTMLLVVLIPVGMMFFNAC